MRDSSKLHLSRLPGRRWAWLPIPVLLLFMLALRVADCRTSYDSPVLLAILNFAFSTLASLAVAWLMGRSFLLRRTPSTLLVGCGILIWGIGSFVAPLVGGSHSTFVTIHNLCVWLGSCGLLAGVTVGRHPPRAVTAPGLWIAAACIGVAAAVWLIAQAVLGGSVPVFFVQGQGGTVARQFVLASTISMLLLSAALLQPARGRAWSAFATWYALALLLLATSLFGAMIQTVHGSLLGWIGRLSHCLGGVYLIVAALAAAREAGGPTLPPESARIRVWQRGLMAVAMVVTAAAVRMAFLPDLGTRAAFVTFYPAVILAALYGGLWAGLLATVLSALLANFFWMDPVGRFAVANSSDWLSLVTFCVSCALISWIAESKLRIQARAAAAEEQARAAAEIERAHQRTATILEGIADTFFAVDSQWRFTIVNPAAARAPFGRPAQELLGKVIWDVLPALVNTRIQQHYFDAARMCSREHYVSQSPLNGRWYEVFMQGRTDGVDVYMRDITTQQHDNKILQTTLQRLNLLVSSMHGGVLFVGEERVELANQTFCDYFQLRGPPADLIGLNPSELMDRIQPAYLHPEREVSRIAEIVRQDRPVIGEEIAMRGGRFCLRDFIPLSVDGKPCGRFWYHVDITGRRQAEERLRESEARLQFALETSQTGAWDLDLADHAAFRSREHDRIFGYAELLPQWTYEMFLEHVLPEDRAAVDAHFQQAVATQGDWNFECRIRRADGATRWIWAAGRHRADAAGGRRRLAGIVQDITARKDAEARIQQQVATLRASNLELERFNNAMVNRELRMIELKQEVNGLCRRLGQPPPYVPRSDGEGPADR